MHKLIEAAGRRSAGLAAGVILTGGLVGGVLLAPAAAYAATTTSTTVTATAQGSAIDVTVSVSPTGATGRASVSDGAGGSCSAFVGNSGSGSCTISNVSAGTYTVTANYQGSGGGFPGQGSGGYSPSSGSTSVTVAGGPSTPTPGPTPGGNAPVWSADSPSTSVDGSSFSYQFQATGATSYSLSSDGSWLGIDPSSGMVSGTIPDGITSFTFRVGAQNNYGQIWTGWFTVFFRHHHHNHFGNANIDTSLSCPTYVFTGQRGTCTLWVTNDGNGPASDVTAQITLPWQLKADYCGYYYWFSYGCSISDNTASEDLGTLYPGHSSHLSVTFTARTGFNLFGWHHGHRDTVRVVGSASAGDNFFGWYGGLYYPGQWFGGQRTSYSVAYVTIIPRGIWW